MRWLRRSALLVMTAAKVRTILTIASATAMAASPPMHAESILTAVTLVVTVLPRILLRLAAAGDERGQSADVLSALMAARVGLLLVRLRLMLRTILHLLVARREGLGIARQVRLLLRFARRVAWLVLTHERLGVVIVAVKSLIGVLLAGCALLLRLLVVIRVLLTELFLRGGNQAKIMLGMLIVVLSGDGITGALRVACELNVFFRNVGSGTTDFNVGTVGFVNARQWILAFAVVAASPHALLTISHDVPVCRLSSVLVFAQRSTKLQVHANLIARPDLHLLSAPMIKRLYSLSR